VEPEDALADFMIEIVRDPHAHLVAPADLVKHWSFQIDRKVRNMQRAVVARASQTAPLAEMIEERAAQLPSEHEVELRIDLRLALIEAITPRRLQLAWAIVNGLSAEMACHEFGVSVRTYYRVRSQVVKALAFISEEPDKKSN
jgi:hypothetical protein